MKPYHTPGPWIADLPALTPGATVVVFADDGGHRIPVATVRAKENAPIVAAAPLMLSALQGALARLGVERLALVQRIDPEGKPPSEDWTDVHDIEAAMEVVAFAIDTATANPSAKVPRKPGLIPCGAWRDGADFVLEDAVSTDRVLFGMVPAGLVKITGQDADTGLGHYEVTTAGRDAEAGR